MAEQPVLETERLWLRSFAPGDAGRVQALAGDERIAAVTATIPHPYPDGVADAWIATHPRWWQDGTGVAYAVTLKADKTLIGTVSIMGISNGEGELGYWVGVPYWGQGYCTEAVREVVRFMAESHGVRHLHARHLSSNPASGRVLTKAGLAHRGRSVAQCGYQQEQESIEVYELKMHNIKLESTG